MNSVEVAGKQVPSIGQGTWNMGDTAAKRAEELSALRRGIDLGLTVLDTAEMYANGRSETLVGEAIAGRRASTYLVSKVLPSNASRKGTLEACERSLQRLGTDSLDLYLLHWPGAQPLRDTVAAFEELRSAGRIKAWGVSNFDVAEMERLFALEHGPHCAANQILYNPEYRGPEFDLLPWCLEHKVAVMAYSPVGQGGDLLRSPALRAIAARHEIAGRPATPAQVALAWELRQPLMVIPKAGTVAHVEANAAAAALQLTSADLAELDRAYPPPTRKLPLSSL